MSEVDLTADLAVSPKVSTDPQEHNKPLQPPHVVAYAATPPVVNPTYRVIYDGNGNTGGSDPIDPIKYGEGANTIVLGFYTLTKDGSSFDGWNTEPDGSGKTYLVGSPLTVDNETITLYAQWSTAEK